MTASQMTRKTFLQHLQISGLFTPNQLQAISKNAPAGEGKGLALALVKAGKLTIFQAELLLAGKSKGFVIGQYVIQHLIGKGGLGRVYKAIQRSMNRVVALKVLLPELLQSDDAEQIKKAKDLFHREVLAVGKLHHPNIATAFDANVSGNKIFLVMEFVDGPNLEQLVRKKGPLRATLACEIIRQAAAALQCAYEKNMLHRDIKPANILVQRGQNGEPNVSVKVVDFGLARLHAPGEESEDGIGTIFTRGNTVMGTPDFLSPEQARSLHDVDIRADLYSLGCTLYYLLTARVPFPGGTSLEKVIRQTSEDPTPIEQIRPDLPMQAAAIQRKLMAKDPHKRFQIPAELMQALAPLCGTSSPALPLQSIAKDARSRVTKPSSDVSSPTPKPNLRGESPVILDKQDTDNWGGWPETVEESTDAEDQLITPTHARRGQKRSSKVWVLLGMCAVFAAIAIGCYIFFAK